MPLQIVRNDITHMAVDAIVNAANRTLLGGGGVDGAIHRAAGPGLLEECQALGGCEVGQAKLTDGYDLPSRYVIHTVGPIWRGGNQGERALLASCYTNALRLAEAHDCQSVAFPLISAGAYGYPPPQAMEVAVEAITDFLTNSDMLVYIVVFGRENMHFANALYENVVEYIDDVYVETHFDANAEARRAAAIRSPQAAPPPKKGPGLFHGQRRFGRPAPAARPEPKPARPDADASGAPTRDADDALDWGFEESAGLSGGAGLNDLLAQIDEGFSEMLLRKIDEKHMTDAECYKRANIDRRLFNKIKNNPEYRTSKQTVLAFAIALRLSLPETREMLMKAGYALSHSSKSDIVVEYCITHGNYNIMEINQVLFRLDLQTLG